MFDECNDPLIRPGRRMSPIWQSSGSPDDVRVAVGPDDGPNALRAETIVHAEIRRLEQVFSTDDDNSMLNRWIDDPAFKTSNEFDELLSTALRWQRTSRGVFNVSTRRLRNLWERAAADGCQPSPGELHELAIDMAEAPYCFDGHLLRQLRDCRGLELRSIVKAFIVDVAAQAAWSRCGLSGLTVSAHSKVVHRGSDDVDVGIEALTDRFGDSPAFTLRNGAVAMRRSEPRDLSANRERANDVFDPLRGRRVSAGVSVAVVGPDATTAAAIAMILNVMTPERGLDFVDALNSPGPATHPSEFSTTGSSSGPIRCWILDTHSNLHYAGPRSAQFDTGGGQRPDGPRGRA